MKALTMDYDWDELANFAGGTDLWYPTYAEELLGISPEQMNSLYELEGRRAISGDEAAIAALDALLDEICESIQPMGNDVLAMVEEAIIQVQSTGVWADLDEIVDVMRRGKRAIRKEAIGVVADPQRLREHLEQEARLAQAIERAEAALDAADNIDDLPFMRCLPPSWEA